MIILGSQRFIKGPTGLRFLRRGGGGGPDYASATIGDYIGGGVYAGIQSIGGTNYHIICGDTDSDIYGKKWKIDISQTAGTTSNVNGLGNTNAMVAAGIANHPAAQHCVNYRGGDFDDWHMPARNQVSLIRNNLSTHPTFTDYSGSGNDLWTSTEHPTSTWAAWARTVTTGNEIYEAKSNDFKRVRPIRRVAVEV